MATRNMHLPLPKRTRERFTKYINTETSQFSASIICGLKMRLFTRIQRTGVTKKILEAVRAQE
jgi:hypothetical protein